MHIALATVDIMLKYTLEEIMDPLYNGHLKILLITTSNHSFSVWYYCNFKFEVHFEGRYQL